MTVQDQQLQDFTAQLSQHRKILFKVAGVYCADAADQQDLMQETTIQLWQSFDRFDGRSQFSTWMYRVALNVAISWSRNELRRTRRTVPIDDIDPEAFAANRRPDQAFADLDLLNKMLGQLGELDRALMLLHLEGQDHNSIANILGISTTNIATKIGRIKQRLQQEFGHD